MMIDRAAAWGLLTEFTQSESLRKHALAVEACMRAYAKKFSGKYAHKNIPGGVGHNLPQEAPQAFAKAVIEVDGY